MINMHCRLFFENDKEKGNFRVNLYHQERLHENLLLEV
jgi:hypothetical protein